MSGYEYGNARLRAMKSRLLTRHELEILVETGSLQGLIAALTKTAYRKPVEVSLARVSGMESIAESLRYDLINTVGKVRNFYSEQPGEMVMRVLRSYDIQNLKAILRGLSKQATTGEITFALIPIGELKDDVLSQLAGSQSPRAAIDVMASQRIIFAQPLLKLRAEHPGSGTTEMELALDRWYFQEMLQFLHGNSHNGKLLHAAIQLEADLINLLTVLRFAHSPGERKFLREWLHTEELDHLFVGPGKLTYKLLAEAGSQDTLNGAVEILVNTPFERPLREGLKAYAQTALLSDIEKHLNRFRLTWMSGQITKDPLGIGVLLGYVALKINEVRNIRWIAQGVSMGLEADTIRSEMEYTA